ncbi:MAG: hypothetical protein K2M89_04625 [Clostridiales bacterium]|nr:hypothetical protein [Clostridiales bacterium]
MVYTVISAVCILIMVTLVAYLIVKFCRYNRSEKIEFIKNFKKGKCAIIYVVAIPLIIMTGMYSGREFGNAFFYAISEAVQLVVLKFNVTYALIGKNVVFTVAFYLCISLVTVNAMMITVSILHQGIWKSFRLFKFVHAKGDKCIVVGNNEKMLAAYDSCTCAKLLIAPLSNDETEKLYIKGVSYQTFSREERLREWLNNEIKRNIRRLRKTEHRINVIINCDNDRDNLDWSGSLVDFISKMGNVVSGNVDIYVFGNREFEDIYSKYEEKSRGCLHYINEFQQIAVDFIDKFPLTKYMDSTHIDYKTALIKPQTDINVVMIGFGRTNQQIFLSMAANNQFLTQDPKRGIVEKRVSYHLFDKLHTDGNKNLNHNYFRYRSDFFDEDETGYKIKVDESKYLPLPQFPSMDNYHYMDINDPRFYGNLQNRLIDGDNALNYIIISLGMDYASIDMANKIVARLKECNIHNAHLFVHIRNEKTFKSNNIILDRDLCEPFGSDLQVIYDYSHIIRERFTKMAIARNFIYNIEHDMRHNVITAEEESVSRMKWYTKRVTTERDSNMYACLAIKTKLHLMGLDCCRADEGDDKGLSEDEYLAYYAVDDMPDFVRDKDGHAVAVRYTLDFKPSRRRNLAEQEHCRWNAFMITKGFVPATREQILNEVDKDGKHTNGKNYTMRHHGNLTTFDGLSQFSKMLAERDNRPQEEFDVIKYDYQLLDGAWWLLNKYGYKIIERAR